MDDKTLHEKTVGLDQFTITPQKLNDLYRLKKEIQVLEEKINNFDIEKVIKNEVGCCKR